MKKIIGACLLLVFFVTNINAQKNIDLIFTLSSPVLYDSLFPVNTNAIFENYCFNPDSAMRMKNVRFPNAILNEDTQSKVELVYGSENDTIWFSKIVSSKRKNTADAWQFILKTHGSPTDSVVSLVGKRYYWEHDEKITTLAQLDRITGRLWFKSYLKQD